MTDKARGPGRPPLSMQERDLAAEERLWGNIYEKPDDKEPDNEKMHHWYIHEKKRKITYPAPGEEVRRTITGRTFIWMLAKGGERVPEGTMLVRLCHKIGCIRPEHHMPIGDPNYKPRTKQSYAEAIEKRRKNRDFKNQMKKWSEHLARIT